MQELLSHHAGNKGDEKWNLCLSWQAGTVTMAQIASHRGNCSKKKGSLKTLSQAGWGLLSVSLSPFLHLTQAQTAKEPACHQGHTDGSLLGGSGCNTDLRAKVFFAAAHIRIHTTVQQINTFPSVEKCLFCLQSDTTRGTPKTKGTCSHT